MRGTIVLDNATGRALRKTPAVVRAANVLDCAGGFDAGDTVYIAFRSVDGGQFVIATGLVGCDERTLRRQMQTRAADAVVQAQDVRLLW